MIPEEVIKLLLALLIGGLIGAEREFRDKAAGFRTIILICTGATLFTIFSLRLGADEDPVRIAASIVSGVGFLGAGVILRGEGRVVGLTTAATIWLSAALGMGIGGGQYRITISAAIVILIILWIFPQVEAWIDHLSESRFYTVICPLNDKKFDELEVKFKQHGLRIKSHNYTKKGQEMTCSWECIGSPKKHGQLTKILFADSDIKEFHF